MLNITNGELMNINSPYRYIGEEYGQSNKFQYNVKIRVALCYPNLYDIGMNNYEFMFLYNAINNLKDVSCERCFLPDADFEELLERKSQNLYTLETKSLIDEFDFVIFVIDDIFDYTNVLKMLEQSNVNRENNKITPILIGILGEKINNPYPLSQIFDAIVIRDYELIYKDLFFRYEVYKSQNLYKEEILESISKLDNVFVKGKNSDKGLQNLICKKNKLRFPNIYFPVSNIASINQKIIIRVDTNLYNEDKDIDEYINNILKLVRKTGLLDIQILTQEVVNYKILETILGKLILKNNMLNIEIKNLEFNKESLKSYELSNITTSKVVFNITTINEKVLRNIELALKNNITYLELNIYLGKPNETYHDLEEIACFLNDIKKSISHLYIKFKSHISNDEKVLVSISKLELKYKFLKQRLEDIKCDYESVYVPVIRNIMEKEDPKLINLLSKAYEKGVRFYGNLDDINFEIWKECINSFNF